MMAIRNYWFPIQSIMIHHILLLIWPIETTTGKCWSHQHPLSDDYFNRQYFQLEQNYTSYQFDMGGNCRHIVRDFSVEDVVACFDSLSAEKQRKPMHIAFIGDSTVRLHYINFLRVFTQSKISGPFIKILSINLNSCCPITIANWQANRTHFVRTISSKRIATSLSH